MNNENSPKVRVMTGAKPKRQRFSVSFDRASAELLQMAAEQIKESVTFNKDRSVEHFMRMIIEKASVQVAMAILRQGGYEFDQKVELLPGRECEFLEKQGWVRTRKKSAFMDHWCRWGNQN